jgi:phosphoribosylformimino-5-aminoimidazole carboxamide ribotide isomerase
VRSQAIIDDLLALGLSRLVLGTAALKQADWFHQMCAIYPERLVLGIDAKNGFVATEGWHDVSQVQATELADWFRDAPLAAIVYTDIATDGMLQGPNVSEMARMQAHVGVPVVASGGVTTVNDIKELATAGMAGAIIGRALYEETVELGDAIQVAKQYSSYKVSTSGVDV